MLASVVVAWDACGEPATVGIHAGWAVPSGDLAHEVSDGFSVGLSFTKPTAARTSAVIDANYCVLGDKTSLERVLGFPLILTERANIFEAALTLRVDVGPSRARVAPYLKAGFGVDYVHTDATLISPSAAIPLSDLHAWPAFLGGAGVSLRMSASTGIRLEGVFRTIQTETTPADLVTVGLVLWTNGRR